MGDTLYPLVLEIDDSLDIKRKAEITCERLSPSRDFHNVLIINSILLFFGKAVIRQANKLNFETHTCMFKNKSGTRSTTAMPEIMTVTMMMVIVVIIINMTAPIIIITVVSSL